MEFCTGCLVSVYGRNSGEVGHRELKVKAKGVCMKMKWANIYISTRQIKIKVKIL